MLKSSNCLREKVLEATKNKNKKRTVGLIPLRMCCCVSPRHQPQHSLGAVRPGQTVPSAGLRSQPVFLLLQQPALVPPDVQHRIRALSALLYQSDIASELTVLHPVPPLHGEPDGALRSERHGLCAPWPAFFQQLQPKHPGLQAPHSRGLSWDRWGPEQCC